jgi:DNA-binding Lrp family transcriptional regulator
VLDECDWRMAAALNTDGRVPTTDLAEAAGVSTSTAHRRLERLLAEGGVRLRCDLARSVSGWTTLAWWFPRCPAALRLVTGRAPAQIPEGRATVSTAGPYDFAVALWLRSLADLEELEIQLAAKAPHVDVADRAVVIRPGQRVGRLLDVDGYAAGVVPCDPRGHRTV